MQEELKEAMERAKEEERKARFNSPWAAIFRLMYKYRIVERDAVVFGHLVSDYLDPEP